MLDDSSLKKNKNFFLVLSLAYLAFVFYGSLVPLHFQPVALSIALERFKTIPFLNLGMDSLADWVANLLLFIPLAFFLTGLAGNSGVVRKTVTSTLVIAFCVVLSGTLEFVQIFFPPRTVSQNDIFAESLGSLLGVGSWWIFGPLLVRWLAEWKEHRSPAGVYERLLYGYLLIILLYSILPLDLTISPVEIYHKCKAGRLILVPYRATGFHAKQVYELFTGIAMYCPIAVLLVASGKAGPRMAWLLTVASAICVEVAQLFVYSRTTATTDVLFACIGGFVGSLLGKRMIKQTDTGCVEEPLNRMIRIGLAMFILSSVLVFALFWYPFNFVFERQFIVDRLALLRRVPFTSYYYVSEFQAIDYLIRRLIFFSCFGASLAVLAKGLRGSSFFMNVIALALICTVALIVELGRIALPTKVPDSIDIIVEIAGAWAGYKLTAFFLRRLRDDIA